MCVVLRARGVCVWNNLCPVDGFGVFPQRPLVCYRPTLSRVLEPPGSLAAVGCGASCGYKRAWGGQMIGS